MYTYVCIYKVFVFVCIGSLCFLVYYPVLLALFHFHLYISFLLISLLALMKAVLSCI